MKTTDDLVKDWIRKADSDLANAQLCVASSTALDTACFHAQQAAEKLFKKTQGQTLTPCAVQLRYDEDFWPSEQEATDAVQIAQALRAFIVPLLPKTMQPLK